MADDIPTLRRILRSARTIAVVGLSAEWHRPSFFAAKYMQEHGYRIVPVNPRYPRSWASAATRAWRRSTCRSTSSTCFRRTEDVLPIARAGDRHRREVPLAADRRREEPRGGAARCRRRPRRGDGPLRQDRARAPVRRPALGRRQHRRGLGPPRPLTATTPWPTASFHPETLAIHAGQIPDAATGARAPADLPDDQLRLRQRRPRRQPVQPADLRQRLLARSPTRPSRCSRSASPRSRAAAPALASASGMAAEMIALLDPAEPGRPRRRRRRALRRHASACSAVNLEKLGIETTFVDAGRPETFAAAIRPNTRAVFAESSATRAWSTCSTSPPSPRSRTRTACR